MKNCTYMKPTNVTQISGEVCSHNVPITKTTADVVKKARETVCATDVTMKNVPMVKVTNLGKMK